MTFTWTPAQLARVVPGATVAWTRSLGGQIPTGRVEVIGRVASSHVMLKGVGSSTLCLIDPASLRAPTLTWLRKMARRKLGKGAVVGYVRDGDGLHVFEQGSLVAYFADRPCHDDGDNACARRSCALWLHALGDLADDLEGV